MRHLFPLFIVLSCLLTFLPGCEPKEDMVQTSGSLELAADTVLFDTVFTTIKTVTKRLWVYNRNAGAVKTDVSLGGTAGSTYSLVINGDAGPAVGGVTIRGKDSLLVLVRAVLGDNGQATTPKQFIVTDEVRFRTNGNEQSAKLVAYGQNAYFHRADIISANTTWRTDKPHVIFNASKVLRGQTAPSTFGVLVEPQATLTIPSGARIYSHAGALLLVGGRLLVGQNFLPGTGPTDTVKATNPNIVRFQGDRLEPFYADIPGQWGGIVFTAGSSGNRIRYAEIKNATFGTLLFNPEGDPNARPNLRLENTVIKNISGSNISFANATASAGGGVISYSGDVTATNCLFTNCGEYAVVGVGGGVYDFNFCTVANFTPSFRRETSSFSFTNEKATDERVKLFTDIRIRNSIVWGSFDDELFFKNYTGTAADYKVVITNSLLRTKEYATTPSVIGGASANNLVNEDPLFKRTSLVSSRPDYSLQLTSPSAVRRSVAAGPPPHLPDLLNLQRLAQPSMGAYEFKP
ncbi:MAG TPA: hypothetical protein VF629_01735 [Hymenobacter sp.]|jgi:hypothetical protein|uniref:hypothetical protein n=1 Tax=Hymenobacter sp. TaxID=1898978 RepID=UPI002EDA4F15